VKPAIERGEKCYNARLTEEQVRLARAVLARWGTPANNTRGTH
jgi:hypothetical protein